MSSPSARRPHFAAPLKHEVPARAASAQSAARAQDVDRETTPEFSVYGDPLFGMAIASVVIFALLAALIATS